jgi:cytochrome c oxidase cbb3-type subunit I/II
MPSYPWLYKDEVDTLRTPKMIWAMRKLGVPYSEGYESTANNDLRQQQQAIVTSLQGDKLKAGSNTEIVALIAYLQRIGKDIKAAPKEQTSAAAQGVIGN